MKRIVVIDDSPVFREFLKTYLSGLGFEILPAINGLDGSSKIRSEVPDLIIMDYYISRKSCPEILKEKDDNPNTRGIPVILITSRVDREKIARVARYNVKKVLGKPVKIDMVAETISKIFRIQIDMDQTPCSIDAHLNDRILFVEIARGLNREKLALLKFKIAELIRIHQMKTARVLVMMTGVTIEKGDQVKLIDFLSGLVENYGIPPKHIKILTANEEVRKILKMKSEIREIGIVKSLEEAMDGLLGKRGLEMVTSEKDNLHEKLFSSSRDTQDEESFLMRFQSEENISPEDQLKASERDFTLAVVDDDVIVHEIVKNAMQETSWKIDTFEDGEDFVRKGLAERSYDLIFLDIMMPQMNGFQVLEHMKKEGIQSPVIILSALSRKESVMKAMDMGVLSYIVKPLKPQELLRKAAETLMSL